MGNSKSCLLKGTMSHASSPAHAEFAGILPLRFNPVFLTPFL